MTSVFVVYITCTCIIYFLLKEIESHPAFMKDVDYTKPLSKEMEGLMRLKYEQQDPTSISLLHEHL